jgi:hypothetical protein
MRIQFIKTGPNGMEPRSFRLKYARNAKVFFAIFHFFGIVFSWGEFDPVAMFEARRKALLHSTQSAKQPQLPILPANRAQRRRLMHDIKKQRLR